MRRPAAVLLALLPACGEEEPAPVPPAPPAPQAAPESEAPPGWPPKHDADAREGARRRMVEDQIARRGVRDAAVLDALRVVPRHRFVPKDLEPSAYDDAPLPIGEEQTISQPYIVASMTEELKLTRTSRVLEIGTGSGYQAAILARITPHVFTIEIKEKLAEAAAKRLADLGYATVRAKCADGYFGWAEHGPFDAILVTAAAPHVPPPLVRQLKPGGRLILPVGQPFATQDLVLVTKDADGRVRTKSLYPVRFVPLTGALEDRE